MRAAIPAISHREFPFGRHATGWLVIGLIILATTSYLFGDGLMFVARQWSEPEYSHGWLIPAVTLFVLWSRREALLAARQAGSWLGLLTVAVALMLFIFSEMAFVQRGPFICLVMLLFGLLLAALGARSAWLAALPIAFLLFAFPLPGSLAVPLSTTLQLISSKLGAAILDLLGISVFLDGNIIDLGVYKLQVAEACSGLRYLFPLASFGFLCAWMFKGPWWARALILLSTIPVTVLTNSGRIALTGVFIEYGSIELAEGFMHLFEGWVIFLVALAILFAEMWLILRLTDGSRHFIDMLDFDRLAAQPAGRIPHGPDRASSVATPARVPGPLVACAGLLLAATLAFGPLTARDQLIPERPGLATFPLYIDGWAGQTIPIADQSVLASLGASDYLLADFTRSPGMPGVNLWIAYYDNQLGNAAIHSPKDCLPGGGWEYVSLTTIRAPVTTVDGRSFMLNRGLIAKGLEQMVIYYWLEMRGRQLTNDTMLKLYNLWDSYSLRRSDGALVRLMSPVLPGETPGAADERIEGFLKHAYPLLAPHVGA
jgi:exosortase D (VPLPA-CTERM-specific)